MDNFPASKLQKYGVRAVPTICNGDVTYTAAQQEITGDLELLNLPGVGVYFRVIGGDGTTVVDLLTTADVGDGQGFISLGNAFSGFQGGQYGANVLSAFSGVTIPVMDKIRFKAILNAGTPPTSYWVKVRGILQVL
jgi:hypothetical protein